MQSALATLLRGFWGICTFRLKPQDIPRSSALLALTTVANVGLSTLINQLKIPLASALLVAALEMLVLFGLTSALLFVNSYSGRIVQTLTALMGAGSVIGGLVFGVLLFFPALPQPLRVGIFLWNLLVMAFVLKHALDTRFIFGFFISIGYAIFLIQLVVFVGRLLGAAPV